MKQGLATLLAGIIFGLGLTVSGMTQPQKVIGFLDIFGQWDPSLAFVMIGAIIIHFVAYRIKNKRTSPLLAPNFQVPTNKQIDKKLIIGSVIFGAGWGIGGYCPGPAITSLVSLKADAFVFVAAMAVGMILQDYITPMFAKTSAKEGK